MSVPASAWPSSCDPSHTASDDILTCCSNRSCKINKLETNQQAVLPLYSCLLVMMKTTNKLAKNQVKVQPAKLMRWTKNGNHEIGIRVYLQQVKKWRPLTLRCLSGSRPRRTMQQGALSGAGGGVGLERHLAFSTLYDLLF